MGSECSSAPLWSLCNPKPCKKATTGPAGSINIVIMVVVPHGVTAADCHVVWCCSYRLSHSMVSQLQVVAQHGVTVAGCCVVWCHDCSCCTTYGVMVMAIAPCGVVVVVGVITLCDVAVTIIALCGAVVTITLSCVTLALARTLKASSLAAACTASQSLHPPAYPTQT
jgi:hypothetical protein